MTVIGNDHSDEGIVEGDGATTYRCFVILAGEQKDACPSREASRGVAATSSKLE